MPRQQRALLVVLQGMDTAGKDGTVRHIFERREPRRAATVASPSRCPLPRSRRHDFLWRCHAEGTRHWAMIGIFNRSHYEDVLSPRVHGQVITKRQSSTCSRSTTLRLAC